ncbi:MAG TPA: glycoside hydrolase family 9 protein, partial [bacterium]|nr:glycoside hydrolase family 9 protein [bacterium]
AACTAHASRLMAGVPTLARYAAQLKSASLAAWVWVQRSPDTDPVDLSYTHYGNLKLWAASELLRLEPGRADALAICAAYPGWAAMDLGSAPIAVQWSAVNLLQTPGLDPALASALRGHLGALADHLFSVNDNYNSGMDPTLYSWNSNSNKAEAGMDLYWAAKLGAPGARGPAQCLAHAEDFLHYLHGANPLDMCYFSNAAALGAGHGVWHLFHGWFGAYADPRIRALYVGKPSHVDDPLYPYFNGSDNFGVRDSEGSQFGPPPGYVPDGPTYQYKQLNGQSSPPLAGLAGAPYAKAYRDWNWVDGKGTRSQPWIVNESGIGNTCSSLLLCAIFSPN